MTYIDDWGSTPKALRDELERLCSEPSCGHMRYQHGDARELRHENGVRYVEFADPGVCLQCRCRFFCLITADEVMDVAFIFSQLTHLRLEDLGIPPWVRSSDPKDKTRY